jgi:hypothetical protein
VMWLADWPGCMWQHAAPVGNAALWHTTTVVRAAAPSRSVAAAAAAASPVQQSAESAVMLLGCVTLTGLTPSPAPRLKAEQCRHAGMASNAYLR